MTFLADVGLALKILAVAIVYIMVASNVPNKLLGTIAFLFLSYYIIFAQWNIWSLFVIGFFIFTSYHLMNFVQDIVFQYGNVEQLDAPKEAAGPVPYYMMIQMGRRE